MHALADPPSVTRAGAGAQGVVDAAAWILATQRKPSCTSTGGRPALASRRSHSAHADAGRLADAHRGRAVGKHRSPVLGPGEVDADAGGEAKRPQHGPDAAQPRAQRGGAAARSASSCAPSQTALGCGGALPQRTQYASPLTLLRVAARSMNCSALATASCFFR